MAVLLVAALALVVAAPDAGAARLAGGGRSPVAEFLAWLGITSAHADTVSFPGTPKQVGGTAKNRSHTASAKSTRAGRGTGHAPGRGRGELDSYSLQRRGTQTGRSGRTGAGRFDAATSRRVPARSSATMTYFQNADGSVTRNFAQHPVNYRTAAGWQPIDSTLVRDGGRWREKADAPAVSVAADATGDGGDLVTVPVGTGESVGWSLRGAADVTPDVSGSVATYHGVLPATDLVEQPTGAGAKESVVLDSASAASSWTFPLHLTGGVHAAVDKDGVVVFTDSHGKAVARVPAAFAEDSAATPGSGGGAKTWNVTYSLVDSGDGKALKVTLDRAWLTDPARVFPVTVDPTLIVSIVGTTSTTYVDSIGPGDYSSDTVLNVGDCIPSVCGNPEEKAVSLIKFPTYPDNKGYYVTAAQLALYDTWTSTCTANPTFYVAPITQGWPVTGSKSYPGPAKGAAIGSAAPATPHACQNRGGDRSVGDWVYVNLDPTWMDYWSFADQPDYGLAVYADTGSLTWRRFDSDNVAAFTPYLSVTYSDIAPQVDAQYPPNGYGAPTLTPELVATGHDPDTAPNAGVQYDFLVYDATGAKIADSGLVARGDWTVPAGTLKWAQTYYWTVETYDGSLYSVEPSWSSLVPQVPGPVLTSALSEDASAHGFDPATGNYTTTATDADVPGAGPALQIVRDYNSLASTTAGAFGPGWSSALDAHATEMKNAAGTVIGLLVTYPDGSAVAYGRNADGSFSPPQGRFATVRAVTGGYTLTDKNGTVYSFTRTGFGLASVTDANGRALTFAGTGARPDTITSAVSHRVLHLTYNTSGTATGQVATVSTDPVTPGSAGTALTWTYSYTAGKLTKVCPPTSATACTTYGYTDGSQFPNAVLNAGAHSYWRLGEASGATTATSAVIANEGADTATYNNVALGQPGPLAGSTATAAGFNGTSGYVQLPSGLVQNTTYQTVSLWFKTTATTAGTLFSTGHSLPGAAVDPFAMPVLYVGSDGKLHGHYWDTTVPGMASTTSVNDGGWHHAVLAAAGGSQALYLDGTQVGTLTGQLVNADPYNFVGAGVYNNNGWPAAPSGNTWNYFNGTISDVAFFTKPLTGQEVSGLYSAGTTAARLLNQVTRPSGAVYAQVSYDGVSGRVTQVTDDNGGVWKVAAPTVSGSSQVYRSAVLGSNPAGYYRLGDTAGAAQAVSEVNYGAGTYANVNLGAPGPFGDETAASFDGSSSYLLLPSTDQVSTGPNSVELWFRTQAGDINGGVLFDEEQCPLLANPTCGGWNPALYVGTDGRLHGEFWINNIYSGIVSSSLVNDGGWHHVVLAASTSAQTMYLDGNAVGSVNGALSATALGYIYVGAGESGGEWPFHPVNTLGYFNGSIAEFAFYRQQLGADEVAAHYAAYKSGVSALSPTETEKVTDPGGKTLTYAYDVLNGDREIASTDGMGNRTTYGYDTGGFLHTVTDADGDVTTTGHDVRGNVVSQTTCQNQAAQACSTSYYTYYPDDTTAQLTTADPRNDLMLTARDGRSASATDNTYLTSYGYDTRGNATSVTTPPVTGFPNGRTTTVTYSDGTSAYPAYDSGNAPAGLPVKVTSPGGATTSARYFANGDLAETTDADGLVTRYGYDGVGRTLTATVISDTYPTGLTTTYGYDGLSQVTSQTDPPVTNRVSGAVHTAKTTTGYDDDGDVISQTVADLTGGDASRTTTAHYNAHDQMDTSTDAAQNVTTYGYDAYGNRVSETAPDGTVTHSAYDPEGRLLTQTLIGYTGDPVNPSPATDLVESSRAYDPAGRLASITDSMGDTTSYTYTDNGLVASITRADSTGQNRFVQESDSYDAAGNLTSKTTDNGTTTTNYTVDAAARVTASTLDPAGVKRTTTVTYTPDDQPATTTDTDPTGATRTTTASYDPAGNLTSQTLLNDAASSRPAAWWRLNQTTGTVVPDATGNGHTASATNVTWTDAAAGLNGSNSAVTPPSGMVAGATTLSISLWFKTSSASTGTLFATGQDAPGTANPSGNAMPVLYVGSDGKVHGHFWDGTTAGMASPDAANDGTWHHVVLVGAGNSQRLYVDGVQVGTETGVVNNVDPVNIVGAGVYNNNGWPAAPSGNTWNWFNGEISNVQLYYRALTGDEVIQLGDRTGGTVNSPLALTTSWLRDKRGLPTSMTDPDGHTTDYNYDEAGRLAQTTAPLVDTEVNGGAPVATRPVTSEGYDTFGDTVETEDPNGNVTTTGYDADGRKVSETRPPYTPPGGSASITAPTKWEYDKAGNVSKETDPLNHTTQWIYDQLGDMARETAPDGGITHDTYDTNGERLSSTDPTGAQTQATYDFMGRQLTATQLERKPTARSFTTTMGYYPSGWLQSETSPAGVVTSYGYNNAGERTSVTDGAHNTTQYRYDFLGRQTATILADGTSTVLGYDLAGNVVDSQALDATGAVLTERSAEYDGEGNMLSSTDARDNTTYFTYDATGMLTQEEQPAWNDDSAGATTTQVKAAKLASAAVRPMSLEETIITSFGYDAAGHRTRFTDGRDNSWYYTYNSWGLPESTVEPPTQAHPTAADSTITTGYDPAGRMNSRTLPGGVRIGATYDENGNLLTESGTGADAPTSTRTFSYDHDGRMLTAATSNTAPSGAPSNATSETFSYDDRGDLLTASGSAGSSSFTYSPDGEMATRTDAAGTTSYNYDSAGRLGTLSDASTGTSLTYNYNTLNQVASIVYGTGGDVRTFGYDGLHRLTSDSLATATGAPVAAITYGYDPNGNLTSKTTAGFAGGSANTYTYDAANRLTSWNNGTATVDYGYDESGNRTSVGTTTYTYDARDELTSDGTYTYDYTARGTLASRTASTGTLNATTDALGAQASFGGETYTVDALGRTLTAGTGSGGSVNFSYSGTDNLIASDGTATYSWDPSGDLVGVRQSGSSGVLAFTDEHTDVVGEFTGSATNLAGSASYDPFGKVVAGTGMAGRLGYQSGWTDPTTSQVDMAARWYDPSVGQFHNADTVSQDPVPDSVAANPFAYANDDPLDMTDPTGHWPHWAKSLYRGAKHAAHKVGHAIVHAVTHPVQTLSHAADDVMRAGQRAYHAYVAPVVKKVTHAAKVSWHAVRDGYHRTVHAYKRASHAVAKAVKPYVRASVHAVKTAYHKSAAAVKTAAKYVQHHAAAIASFVVSTAVFIGCEAAVGSASGGVGAVATVTVCGALAGEVGGAVSAGVKAVKTGHFSLSDFGREVAFGGLSGAAAGLLGAGAGKLLSPVAGKLTGVLGNLLRSGGGEAATQAAERAAGDAAASGLREAASEAGGNAAENVTSGAARDAGEDTAAQATRSAGREPAADAGGAPDRPAGSDGGPSASREPEHPSSEPSGCSVHSFDPATPVLMADGTHKPIKDVKVGDKVLATDPTTGKTTPEPVLATHDNHDTDLADVTIQDAAGHTTTLHTTWHHPFYNPTTHTFTDAADLTQGTPLQTTPDTRTTAHVVAVRTWTALHDMRDLTIATDHTYYVLAAITPVLVHNVNECGPGQLRGPDGRFMSDPNAAEPDARYARVPLRSSTKQAIREAAQRDEDGNFIDPNTGESIPAEGPYHYGHKPGFEYWRNRNMAKAEDWTREKFIGFENDPTHYQIEDPYNNLSHKYEQR